MQWLKCRSKVSQGHQTSFDFINHITIACLCSRAFSCVASEIQRVNGQKHVFLKFSFLTHSQAWSAIIVAHKQSYFRFAMILRIS